MTNPGCAFRRVQLIDTLSTKGGSWRGLRTSFPVCLAADARNLSNTDPGTYTSSTWRRRTGVRRFQESYRSDLMIGAGAVPGPASGRRDAGSAYMPIWAGCLEGVRHVCRLGIEGWVGRDVWLYGRRLVLAMLK